MATITASIVTYRTPASDLDSCVASLAEASTVWIIDNAADSATAARCAGYRGAGQRVVYCESANVGYGAAHNTAIRRAIDEGADYHLVVNADVSFSPLTLRRAVDFMESRRDVALLHPRLRYPSGREQYTVRLVPSPFDLIAHRFLPRRMVRRRMDRYELRAHDRSRELECAYVQGSFMLLRTAALRDTGLFDERFFMYPEDIDLSRRIAASGQWKVLYAPQFEAVHAHAAASRRPGRMLCVHITNMVRYFNKWGWFHDPVRRRLNRYTLSQS